MAALGREAELNNQQLPMTANGHLRSFEQPNKRSECASLVKIIASIEDPAVINKILAHLDEKAATIRLPPCQAPPVTGLFD